MAGNPILIPIPIPWFKAPCLQFWRIPQAVQRLWEFLKNIAHGGATRFKMTDWELAQALGIGPRCVQKALNLAEALGYIRRYREYGHGGGRVIEIILDLARPKPKPKPKPRPRAKDPKPAATPEQVADAKARELAREQAQAQHDLAREATLRAAWLQLTDAQRDAIRAQVKAENPGLARWANLLEPMCLKALEALEPQTAAPAVTTSGECAGP